MEALGLMPSSTAAPGRLAAHSIAQQAMLADIIGYDHP
jgi:hypothetical protein